jgi:hypothetical protein
MKPANPALAQSTHCVACFTQDHTIRHIDFDAACDRGFGEDHVSGMKISMDDLILCENCIKQAAKMIDMEPIGKSAQTIRELEIELDTAQRERKQAQNYSDRLEVAFDHREKPVALDRRSKPRSLRNNKEHDDE